MKIKDTYIAKGSKEILKFKIAQLPSGTSIHMEVYIFRAQEDGPCVLLTAGIHGDEINGIETLRGMIEKKAFDNLNKGTVIVIPLVNAFGFINFSRDVPDGKDVNRSFPGSANGTLASKISHVLTKNILPLADVVLDFHTGGAARYNYPQFRVTQGDDTSLELAKKSGIELILSKPLIPKSFRAICRKHDKTVLVFEGGESIRYDGLSIQKGEESIEKILQHLGLNNGKDQKMKVVNIYVKTRWVRSKSSGLFKWSVPSGNKVYKGQEIGEINSLSGKKTLILSAYDGYIVGHNNTAVVNHGDPLFNIGIE